MESTAGIKNPVKFTIKLWPPSQNTRTMLVQRMARNLSMETIFSKEHGTLSKHQAEIVAKEIEDKCFNAAYEQFEKEQDDDGSSAVRLYAKDTSRLMLVVLKGGSHTKEDVGIKEVAVDPASNRTCSHVEDEGAAVSVDKDQVSNRTSSHEKEEGVVTEANMDPASNITGSQRKVDGDVAKVDMSCALNETVFDISVGDRDFIDGDKASDILKPLTREGNTYKKICFSNKSFGVEAALIAEPILKTLRGQLTDVDLSDFVAGRPEDVALEVMKIFSSALSGCLLRSLNLSDNALGEKGVKAFGALLESQHMLEELFLMNDGISEEAAEAVSKLIPSTDKLKILHFHNNMMGDQGALAISEMLKHCPVLEDFRCSSTRVASEGGIALAEALKSCSKLKRLDLRDNIFGVDAGKALAETLEQLNCLTEVYLSYLNLEDEGAVAIANALKASAASLEVIDMSGNEITAAGARHLAACIASKDSLQKVILAENELKDHGAVLIGKALEVGHSELNELDMSANMVMRAGAKCLASAVASKPQFKLLNINSNAISDEGIDDVKVILKDGKKSLDVLGPLDENDADDDGLEDEEEPPEAESPADEGVLDHHLESKLEDLKVARVEEEEEEAAAASAVLNLRIAKVECE